MARRPPRRVDGGARARRDRLRRRGTGGEHVRRRVLRSHRPAALGADRARCARARLGDRRRRPDPRRCLAIAGLIVFLTGFEFAFVTSLSLVTEAAPLARGRAIGAGNALGTIARSAAVLASGLLYDSVGIGGSFVLSAAAATIAAGLIVSACRTRDARSTIAAATAAACVFGPKWRASATSTTWQSGSSRARNSVPARWWAAPRSP